MHGWYRRQAIYYRGGPVAAMNELAFGWRETGVKIPALWLAGGLRPDRAYMRSGALIPINSNARRNTIWADSTNFSRAAVMALSSSLEETTRQFS